MLLLLFACAAAPEATDDGALTDSGATNHADDSASGDSASGDSASSDSGGPVGAPPALSSCDAWCWEHDVGDVFFQWALTCSASDPEGLENLGNGDVTVTRGGATVYTELLACGPTGACTSSFREESSGVRCAEASSYSFVVTVDDLDGNRSAPLTVPGRAL